MMSLRISLRILVVVGACIAFLLISTLPSFAVVLSGVTGKVTPDNGTYLYTLPDTSSPRVRLLTKNTPLTMTNTSSTWFKARTSEGEVGWVASRKTELTGQGSPSQAIFRGNTNRKMVAFTFDAGADVGYTESILNTLKNNGIKSSFGLTGEWTEKNPSQTRRIANEGHELINHTLKHNS